MDDWKIYFDSCQFRMIWVFTKNDERRIFEMKTDRAMTFVEVVQAFSVLFNLYESKKKKQGS